MMTDKFHDQCGLFGVYGHRDAIPLTLRGLSALQHRGQESAGLAFANNLGVERRTAMGPVKNLAPLIPPIESDLAIGHVRYGTSGRNSIEFAQPFISTGPQGRIALCHNGHIVELDRLRSSLPWSVGLDEANDSELLARQVASFFTDDLSRAIRDAFQKVTAAYSVLVLSADSLCAVRDPLGMRPLSIGTLGEATVISSETCALDAIGASYVRDVEPGEIVIAGLGKQDSISLTSPRPPEAHCIFELIYFARPDSVLFGHSVADFRLRLGARLALEAPVPADIVVPVPDSAVFGGLGYAQTSGVDVCMALLRNDLVGRSFIEPTASARTATVEAKLSPIASLIRGRRVILVDDSIVRGNTSLHLVRLLRQAGAREVHLRITSPATIASCHFGIDTPDDRELLAYGRTVSDMREFLGADSLEFLSIKGLLDTAAPRMGFCKGCFSGVYPVEILKHSDLLRVVPVIADEQDVKGAFSAGR